MTTLTTRLGEEGKRFLLCKRDLYYRPDNCGYTGIKDYAGRYLESDASPEDGVTAIHEDDAPMFSKACFDDLKVKYLLRTIEGLEAENARLREALYLILCCTPAPDNIYDCGDPFEIARSALHAREEERG